MNDALLMRVLNRLANLGTNSPSRCRRGQRVLVAVVGDPDAADQFHHEVGPTGLRRPGIEHLGDVRMIHQRQRLPFCLEPGDDVFGCPYPA
jgi:hypothetical protein